ncbi:hypothetical protein QQ91_0010675 [Lyngbya confervoides BDU141951]|uniref:Uncharacterized protein n=1 Tax=Lyngbya confervoides BDU141951 TaxID=1574623 RepID=A0ABD4T4A6_9CYAN|nr:hypothetical protein [Lyngbya confervoides BDU141951]
MEVLISILLISAFLATAMQALISATAIKVRSEEISEASNWIQEDLEEIRYWANELELNEDRDGYRTDNCGTDSDGDRAYLAMLVGSLPEVGDRASMLGQRPYYLRRIATPDGNLLKIEHRVFRNVDGDDAEEDGELVSTRYSEVIPDVAFFCP